jgi:hypothetical protein
LQRSLHGCKIRVSTAQRRELRGNDFHWQTAAP